MTAELDDPLSMVRVGPGTLMGRYMRLFWHPVYRAEDLPVGRAKPLRILGEDFTLYRGEGGAPHAVAFRCAHRGTRLSTGWVEGDCIRCFYHGWKYDQTGQCVEMPAEETSFPPKVRIRSYPTQEYLGLIFVYFGDGDPPELPRYRRMEEEGILDVTTDTMPVSAFYSLENDALHFSFVHRDLLPERGLSGIPQQWSEETDWGIASYSKWPNRDVVGVSHKGIPNVGYIVPAAILMAKRIATALHVSWRVPIDDESHVTLRANLTPVTGDDARHLLESRSPSFYDRSVIPRLGDAVVAGRLRLEDIEDRTHIEFIQDYVSQVGQGSTENRLHERLGRSDSMVILYRQILRRELKALAEGRPLKQWRMTERIETPTAGV